MGKVAVLIGAVLFGAVAGFLAGTTQVPSAVRAETPRVAPTVEPAAVSAPAVAVAVQATNEKSLPEDARVTERIRLFRAQAEELLRTAEERALRDVTREIEKEKAERAQLEAESKGDPIALLRAMGEGRFSPALLLADRPRFEALFLRQAGGPNLDPLRLGKNEKIPGGATLSFVLGAHVFASQAHGLEEEFPRDLLIEGAGMDRTLVRLDTVSTRTEIRSLTFRDLTIDCGNHYFTDLRQNEPVVIRLERCRVIRFDMGAGGSSMLYAQSPVAFHALECRIEGGYGRSPGSGNLFDLRGPGGVVLMQRCVIRGPFSSVFSSGASFRFEGCDLLEMVPRLRTELSNPPANVAFDGCRFTFGEEGSEHPKTRPLSDISPEFALAK